MKGDDHYNVDVYLDELRNLVEAARDAAIGLSWAGKEDPQPYIDALEKALKPFEGVGWPTDSPRRDP